MTNAGKTENHFPDELNRLQKRIDELETELADREADSYHHKDISCELVNSLGDIGDGLVLLDKKGTIVDVNRTALKFYGGSRKELVGKHFTKIGVLSPDDIPALRSFFNKIISGEQESIITPIVNKNGAKIYLESNAIFKKNAAGVEGIILVVRDVTARRQTEEKLRFLSLITEQVVDSIITTDLNYKITYVNHAFRDLYGYSEEEILGKSPKILNADPEAEGIQEDIYKTVSERNIWRGDVLNRHKDGTVFNCEVIVFPLVDKHGNIFAFVGRQSDITERVRAAETLQKSEEFKTALIEHSPMGISIRSPKGKLLSVNRAWKKIWNVSEETVQGYMSKEPKKFLFNDKIVGLKKWKSNIEAIYSEGGLFHIPELFISEIRPARPRWVSLTYYAIIDEEGRVERVVTLTNDITERRKAEEALKESERKFRTYVSNAPDGIFIMDERGNCLEVNEAACHLTGYSESELMTMSFPQLTDPASIPYAFESLDELKRKGQQRIEISIKRKDDSIIWISLNAVALSKNHFMAFCSDITETKRLQELESRAQRLETAGKVAGQVAHDFNNLLAPMMAYPELIADDLPDNHSALRYLHSIENGAKRIAEINQQLLTLGRRGYYNLEPMNLNDIVYQTLKDIGSIPSTLIIETDLCDNLMHIMGGRSQLHRVFLNMIHNARDAVGDLGTITIRTENYYVDDVAVMYGRVPKGEYVKLTVSDTGCGIPEGIIQKVFDPFFTTKATDKKRGSGLGLSVVDAVIKDHKGYIDLQSRSGQGTSIYVYFPITREGLDSRDGRQVVGGDETVLVIDDDEVQRDVTLKLLQSLGYYATAVNNGEKAVELLKNNSFDILVLDMIMPGGIDGAETYQQTLEINPTQKAVIVSGYAEGDKVQNAQSMGAGAYIRKPITRKSLGAAVRMELDKEIKTPA
jgi:PAS domain S-box-containing protein